MGHVVIRFLILVIKAHAVWPSAPIADVTVATIAAVRAETTVAPAELLLAIAQHESDLQPRAVSYRRGNSQRVDKVVSAVEEIPERGKLACGLVSTIASTRYACAKLLDPTAAMRAGAAELAEHASLCHGSRRCALASYAGGGAGIRAWRSRVRTSATIFAELFDRRARQLGAAWSGS